MPVRFEDSRDFVYLSDVYVYIEQFGKKGHQIGRKIGDMLEILTMGYCYEYNLKDHMQTEIAIEGFTEANHKVEFSFYKLDENKNLIIDSNNKIDQDNLIGFIECKKVGVEVTVHPRTRNGDLKLLNGESYTHSVNPRWLSREIKFNIRCTDVSEQKIKIHITSTNTNQQTLGDTQLSNSINEKLEITPNQRFLITLVENGHLRIIKPTEKLVDVEGKVRLCHVFKLNKITEGANIKIETCLTGPQTIEKAKQSALVALDVRKKNLGVWGKEQIDPNRDNFRSILVIGEVSHWEDKSRKVVTKTIDHNLVVPDPIVILAFKKFHEEWNDDFLNYINKDRLKTNRKVQELIREVIIENNGEIFYDLEDLNFKKIIKEDNKIKVKDL